MDASTHTLNHTTARWGKTVIYVFKISPQVKLGGLAKEYKNADAKKGDRMAQWSEHSFFAVKVKQHRAWLPLEWVTACAPWFQYSGPVHPAVKGYLPL